MLDHSLTYTRWRFRNIPHMLRQGCLRRFVRSLSTEQTRQWAYADFGCSNGYITDMVSRALGCDRTYGFDHSEDLLRKGRELHPHIRFERASLNAGFDAGLRFDFVTCFETLEHVSDIDAAVGVLFRHVKPGGLCLISVPIEHGFIGGAKFLLRNTLYRDEFHAAVVPGLSKRRYLWSALSRHRMSQFRSPSPSGYAEHYGFDHRDVGDAIGRRVDRVQAERWYTTMAYCFRAG